MSGNVSANQPMLRNIPEDDRIQAGTLYLSNYMITTAHQQ
jgi:hypothetical protein